MFNLWLSVSWLDAVMILLLGTSVFCCIGGYRGWSSPERHAFR